jgi:glycosyltransferase involved in cell wall biosynthesis
MSFISIICPTYNEEKHIAQCIEAVIAQDYPLTQMELLLVDGGSRDRTRAIVMVYQDKYDFIKLLDNPYKIVSHAMNTGISQAVGDIIIRIDAHSFYPSDYIRSLVTKLEEYKADNVGVACETDVLNKTPKTLAIKAVLSNPLGVGNSLFRIGIDKVTEVDTAPFGCYRKEVFEKYGMYNVKLVRNQDIELNKRIKRGGGRILLIPDTFCVYFARETFKAIMKNNYQNGKWNVLTVYYTKMFDSLSIRHFVPMLFVLSLLVPILFSFLCTPIGCLSALSAMTYCILISFVSLKIALAKKLHVGYILVTFAMLHLSYGLGSLIGLICIIFHRS